MIRLMIKIFTAPIVFALILIMGLLSLLIRIITNIFESISVLPVKIVGIFVLLALFTKDWLAAVSFIGIIAVVYLVIAAASFLAYVLDSGRESLMGFMFS